MAQTLRPRRPGRCLIGPDWAEFGRVYTGRGTPSQPWKIDRYQDQAPLLRLAWPLDMGCIGQSGRKAPPDGDQLSMNKVEFRAASSLAVVFSVRLLGLFMIYPVFEA